MPIRPLIGITQSTSVETINENSPLTHCDTIVDPDRGSNPPQKELQKSVRWNITNPASINTDPPKMAPQMAVHWNPKIVKIHHVHLKDINEADRENLWYNKKDDRLILQKAKVVVKMIMKGEPFDDINYCSRGLEGKTPAESKKRVRAKRRVTAAVLMEQEVQLLEGVKNPEHIANAAFKHTKDLSLKAQEQAVEDEHDIKEYLNDVRTYRDNSDKFILSQLSESLPSSE